MAETQPWRRHRFALALIAVVVATVLARPIVRQEVFSFRDHVDYFQPLRYYTAVHLRALILPHWNPYSASGEPWLANPQTGVFYPPTWLFLMFPFVTAYMLYLALHLLILGWSAYLLFTRMASEGAALLGAMALIFCGPVVSLLDISNNLATFAWVPLTLWCAMTRARPELAALVLALAFLGGEPFFAAVAAGLYVVVVRSWKHVVIAGAGALGLSAIQLLPFLEMLLGSDRAAGLTREQIVRESMPVGDWLRLAVPPRLQSSGFDPELSQHFVPMVYVGAVVVALAIVAWITTRNVRVMAWTGLLITAMIVAGGAYLPLIGNLLTAMPLTLFRYPARVVPFGALAVVALAVIGWERIRPRRRWVDLILILFIVTDVLWRAQPLLQSAPFRSERVPYPPAVGRRAKFMRIQERPGADRAAWIAGYVNLYERRFDASTAAPVMSERYSRLHDEAITRARIDLLNLLGVGYLLSEKRIEALFPLMSVRGVIVYGNAGALPMATWWGRAKAFSSPEEALAATLDGKLSLTLAVSGTMERAVTPERAWIVGAESVSVDTRRARVVVNAPADGILMLAQQDAPGWRVFVDGRRARKVLGAGIFRAVEVQAGRHEVVWRFQPRAILLGAIVTIITALSLQVRRFVKRRGQKNFSSQSLIED